jgi:hypothetical protein
MLSKLKGNQDSSENLLAQQAAPLYLTKEDEELGIDRSQIEPVKFVSAIDSRPVYPSYL